MMLLVVVCVLSFADILQAAKLQVLFHILNSSHTSDTPQTGNYICNAPPIPDHGEWKLLHGDAKPGHKILKNSVLIFECHSGYKLSTQSPYLVCDDNWSSWNIPTCEELCPPLLSSDTFKVRCRDKRGREVSCREATHGTFLEYDCARFYEAPFGYKKIFLCEYGSWNHGKPVCQPVCGKKITDEAKPLIVGSNKPNRKLEYPWVVALYQKLNGSFVNICGGSILSQTVVLTAAHCVTNDYGDVLPNENYAIGAGKIYNEYRAPQDTSYAQYLQVSKIIVHDQYKGDSKRMLADIALLVMNGEFALNEVVQPVCFNNMKGINLHAGNIGEVSGWGRTDSGLASDVLRTLKIPYKYETTCSQELSRDWADKYNMIDKICAGFYNQSRSVCDGDSGSGLAFKNSEDNRYYIHGIVSLAPQIDGACDIQQNTLYTKVAFYYEYVDRLLARHAPLIKDCVLPSHPQNGNWTIDKQIKKPGDSVLSSTILKVECNEGFKMSSPTTRIECSSTYNMPTCEKLCPEIKFPRFTQYQCTDSAGLNINCPEAIDGCKLYYNCPRGYKILEGTETIRSCIKGSWGSPQPECIRVAEDCGKVTEETVTKNPWNVVLYKNISGKYKDHCGGSIVSRKVVVTAAYCVMDKDGKELPTEDYILATGNRFINFYGFIFHGTQYTKVAAFLVNSNYGTLFTLGDIALIIVKKAFYFDNYVQPICFGNFDDIQWQPEDMGEVFGWKLKNDSQQFTALQVSYKESKACPSSPPISFQVDVICAQTVNQNITWCSENVGKGLVVKNSKNGRYYLQGIFTIKFISKNGCQETLFFTNVPHYYNFIECILQY